MTVRDKKVLQSGCSVSHEQVTYLEIKRIPFDSHISHEEVTRTRAWIRRFLARPGLTTPFVRPLPSLSPSHPCCPTPPAWTQARELKREVARAQGDSNSNGNSNGSSDSDDATDDADGDDLSAGLHGVMDTLFGCMAAEGAAAGGAALGGQRDRDFLHDAAAGIAIELLTLKAVGTHIDTTHWQQLAWAFVCPREATRRRLLQVRERPRGRRLRPRGRRLFDCLTV